MSEVIREEHTANFTIMSNVHLKDRALSLKAKGLLSLMLSLPPTWNYNVKGLATVCRDGVDSVRSTLLELERAGYLTRQRRRASDGKYRDNEYVIRESPVREAESDAREMQSQIADKHSGRMDIWETAYSEGAFADYPPVDFRRWENPRAE